MKKSKTILRSKLIVFFFLLSIIYVTFYIKQEPYSHYNESTKDISGIVTDIKQTDYGYKLEVKSKEKVIAYSEDFNGKLGNKVKVMGDFQKPNKNTVFNLFNYQDYLKSQKIYWLIKNADVKIISEEEGIYTLKNRIIDYINNYISYKYLNAFILGNDDYIEENIYNSYQINGISHLLAISGTQITLIALSLLFIFNMFFKNQTFTYIVVISLLIFYTFLTGFIPPVIRATLLFIALTIKKIMNLKIDTIYLLLLIASLYLVYNPFIIMNIGFLFSFIISFYLILFAKYINTFNKYFIKLFIISLIAFLGSVPILIYNFHYINLLSPFINLIFVPLVTFIIYPLSVITLILPIFDNVLNMLCLYMENISLYIEGIKIFLITLKHINIFGIMFYYLIITFVIYELSNKKTMALIIFLGILLFHSNINYLNTNAYLTMIDVGQGDCLLLTLPHNNGNILIDTGGKISFDGKSYNMAKKVIIPYLRSEGINNLDSIIVTHGDYDHMGEAINLVNSFKVDKVIFNCGEYNDLEKELISVLDKKNIKYYSCIKELNIDKYNLEFLNTKEYDNENDNSNVIYTELDGYKFMFMGDAGIDKEKDILDKYNITDIDVLKVGHHGSNTSSSKEFIYSINPKNSLISVGENNRYGHPKDEVLKVLKNSKIYRTDEDGSIMFKIKNNKLQVGTCSP